MNSKQILRGLISTILAIPIAAYTSSGIHYDNAGTFAIAVLLLGVFNIVLKPLLMLFSLPFILLTFGLGIWIINAALFYLVAYVVDGFYVESFLSALWGAFVLSVINLIATALWTDPKETPKFTVKTIWSSNSSVRTNQESTSQNSQKHIKDDDVIDI